MRLIKKGGCRREATNHFETQTKRRCPAAVSDLSLHVFVEFDRFFQTGKPPPQVRLVRHLALVLHDLVSGFGHYVLDLSSRGAKKKGEFRSRLCLENG